MIKKSNLNRTLQWEDESSSADLRLDRVVVARPNPESDESVRPTGPRLEKARRNSSRLESSKSETAAHDDAAKGLHVDSEAPDDAPDSEPRRKGWRPTGTAGRVALGLALLLLLAALIALGIFIKSHLDHDVRFQLAGADNVLTVGNTEVSRAEILPVFDQDIGHSVIFIPLSERRRQLEKISWIEQVTVMRVWPDHIRVVIKERTPIAFARQGQKDQQIGLVDASGVLLAMPPAQMAQHHYSFPVITGLEAEQPLAERAKKMAVYAQLMTELDAGGNKFSDQISEVDLSDLADARVLVPEQGKDILVHLGKEYFLQTFRIYKTHIAEWKQQFPRLYAVDLRYDQQAVLKQTEAPTQPLWNDDSENSDGQNATADNKGSVKGSTKSTTSVEPVESAEKRAKADAELAKKSKNSKSNKQHKSSAAPTKRSTNSGGGQ